MSRGQQVKSINLDDDLIFMDYALEIAEDWDVPMSLEAAAEIGLDVAADIVDLVEDYVREHAGRVTEAGEG